MSRTQTLVQLTDHLLALLDERAAQQGTSRSELIRRAVEAYIVADAEAAIDATIRAGYERIPAAEPDVFTKALAISSIESEPW